MDLRLTQLAADHNGLVLTAAAARAGVTKAGLQWAVRRGDLVRIARGAYVPAQVWIAADARGRHLLRLRAALALSPGSVAVAESAAVVWGLPLPSVPELPRLMVPRGHALHGTAIDLGSRDRRGGGNGRRTHALGRRCWVAEEDLGQDTSGIRATTPARTVVDCARHLDRPWALAVADAARRVHRLTRHQLRAVADRHPRDPGHAAALWVARWAVRGAESPLESLARGVILSAGLPAPRVQVWLRVNGRDVRVDLLDPGGRVVVEADGRVKYTDPQALWAEKLREDDVRATGREVLRFTYRDYRDPDPWLCRYRAALTRARLEVRGTWGGDPPRESA